MKKQMVPLESTAEELLFDCSQFKINSSDLKVRTYQSPSYDLGLLMEEILHVLFDERMNE